MLRLPNNALTAALIKLLTDKTEIIGAKAYDYVPEDAQPPFITLGNIVTKDIGTKSEDVSQVSIQINIWSNYSGKREINLIAERIITLLTSTDGYLDTTAEGFAVSRQSINLYEAYPEDEEGYNGVISLEVDITNQEATADDI